MQTLNIAVTLAFIGVIFGTTSCRNIDDSELHANSDGRFSSDVLQVARQVVEAFNTQDGKKTSVIGTS